VSPHVRALDAIDPSDPMFLRIAAGGTTTSLILPGSFNVVGGEALAVKHLQFDRPSITRMVF
jgi:hypothetical protein